MKGFVLLLILLPLILISCYSKHQVMARYPNGNIRVERHRNIFDSLNEIYITYYDNGKVAEKDYWKNRHAIWAPGNTIEWDKEGRKTKQTWVKYKDTIGIRNAADTTYVFKGLYKFREKMWNENGKIQYEDRFEKGRLVSLYYNLTGDTLVKREVRNIRADGYDSLKITPVHLNRVGK